MTDFENIISFENLYKAHRRARLGKRHKKEVVLFEANLSENLWAIHYDLKYGKYRVEGYHSFTIYDPKEREIQAITYRDRVVQHSLCDNYLIPLLDKHLIYDNAACRKNKGTSFAIKRWRKFMCKHYHLYGKTGYFVKADVSKYFPSIDHTILKNKLRGIIDDKRIFELLCVIIDSYNFDANVGLPMGNQTSQCFALFYLDSIDRYIKEKMRIKYYVRYMDDMLLIVLDKQTAKNILFLIYHMLEEHNLKLNIKSQIIPVKNGVTFLGWRFLFNDKGRIVQVVKNKSKERILKRVETMHYPIGKCINPMLSLSSYKGYLKKGNCYKFYSKIKNILLRRKK